MGRSFYARPRLLHKPGALKSCAPALLILQMRVDMQGGSNRRLMQDYLKAAMGEIAAYRKSAESLLDGDALAAMDRFGDVSADDVGTMRVLDQNEIEISALSVTVSLLRQYRIQKGATFTQRQTEVYTAAYRLALEDLIDTLYDLITAGARTRVRKYRESGHIR